MRNLFATCDLLFAMVIGFVAVLLVVLGDCLSYLAPYKSMGRKTAAA